MFRECICCKATTSCMRALIWFDLNVPSGNKCNLNGLDENSLPQELSDICKHGFKVCQVPIKSSFLFLSQELFQHVS